MKNYIALLFFASMLIGCETVVDVDIPLSERRLVVNSLSNPDSIWNVSIALSRHVLDNSNRFEIPATSSVTITDLANNMMVEQLKLSQDDFRYKGSFKPEVEKEYLLKVVTPRYGTVEAVGYIPAKVAMDKVEIDNTNLSPDGMASVKIHFKDPASKKDFYRLTIIEEGFYVNFFTKDTIRYRRPAYFEVDDPALKSNFNFGNELLVDDTFFDGDNYVLAIKISSHLTHPGNPFPATLILSTLSEAYYRYSTTRNLQLSTDGDPFAQPVLVYNNIQNGLGIFGGYNQSVFVLKK